eukprot:2698466-Rhodomonas_salina.1
MAALLLPRDLVADSQGSGSGSELRLRQQQHPPWSPSVSPGPRTLSHGPAAISTSLPLGSKPKRAASALS